MTKSLLSTLKVTARPEKTSENPELKRRERLLGKLDHQLAMADAFVNNEQYVAYKEKWKINAETQLRELIRVPKNIAKWFYKRNGLYYLEIRYANRALEISPKNHAIEVGDKDELTKVISTVISSVIAGEFDKLLTDSASKLTLSKK